MSEDGGELKTFPPTKRKLERARKKGQVAHSRDLVGAATLAAGALAAWWGGGALFAAGAAMLDAAGQAAGLGLGPGLRAMRASLSDAYLHAAVPVMAAVVAAAVLANLVVLRGILFSLDPVKPKFTHVNPAEGLKRLFKRDRLVDLAKTVVKAVLLAVALAVVLRGGLRLLATAPGCGMGCVIGATQVLALALLVTAVLVFVAVGAVDVPLQRQLFTRNMRMGANELKREIKEDMGDPLIRKARRRLIEEAANAPPRSRLGEAQAVVMVYDGTGSVVGLRYVRGETPAPMVVCRAQGQRGQEMLNAAIGRGLPVENDPELTRTLFKAAPPGQWIPQSTYGAAGAVLLRHGLM